MRLWLPALAWWLGTSALWGAGTPARPATPDEVALFKDAIKNAEQEPEHWAYTEMTVSKFSKNGDKGATVVRVDPSKPYAEQFVPLQIDGKPPTAKQLKKYRERGEKRGEKHGEQLAKAEAHAADPAAPGPKTGKEKSLKLDLEHPLVISSDGENCIYRVPLVDHGTGVPPEKIEVSVVVNKASRQIRHAAMRVLESFRVKVVANVKEGEASIDFAVVDPRFGPVMTSVTGTFGVSLVFVPVNAVFQSTRTDWQRVKPYNERFGVKIGPLKALDL